jgi:hypothetical protein
VKEYDAVACYKFLRRDGIALPCILSPTGEWHHEAAAVPGLVSVELQQHPEASLFSKWLGVVNGKIRQLFNDGLTMLLLDHGVPVASSVSLAKAGPHVKRRLIALGVQWTPGEVLTNMVHTWKPAIHVGNAQLAADLKLPLPFRHAILFMRLDYGSTEANTEWQTKIASLAVDPQRVLEMLSWLVPNVHWSRKKNDRLQHACMFLQAAVRQRGIEC